MVSINDKKEEKSVSEKIGAVIMKFRFLFLSVIGILIVAAIAAGIAITVSESSRKKGLETLDSLMYPLTQAVQEEYPAARDAALPEILALAEKNANNVVGVRAYMAAAELYFDMEDWASARDAWVAAAGAGAGAYTAAVCYYNAAVCAENLGDTVTAVSYYEMTVADEECLFLPHALFSLGRLNESSGNYSEAQTYYTKLRDSYPSDFWTTLAESRLIALRGDGVIQ